MKKQDGFNFAPSAIDHGYPERHDKCHCGSGQVPWWHYDWTKVSDPETGVGTTTWVCKKCTNKVPNDS